MHMSWTSSLRQTHSRITIKRLLGGFPGVHASPSKLFGDRAMSTDNGNDAKPELAAEPKKKKQNKKRARPDYHVYGIRKETEKTSTLWMTEHFGVAKDMANTLTMSVPFLCHPTIPDNGREVVKVLLAHNVNVAKIFARAWSTTYIPAQQVENILQGLKRMGFEEDKIARLIEAQPNVLAFPLDETALDLCDKLGLQVQSAIISDMGGNKQLRRGSNKQEATIIANRNRLKGLQIDIEKVHYGFERLLRIPVEVLEKKIQFLQGTPLFLNSEQQINIIHRQTRAFIALDVDEAKVNMSKLLDFVYEKDLAGMVTKTLGVLEPSQMQFVHILLNFGIHRQHVSLMLTSSTRLITRSRVIGAKLKFGSGLSAERQWRDDLKAKYQMIRHYFDHEHTLHHMGEEACKICLIPSTQVSKLHVRLKLLEKFGLISSTNINTLNTLEGDIKPIASYIEASPPKFALLIGTSVEYIQEFSFYYLQLYNKNEPGLSETAETGWTKVQAVSKADLDAIPLPIIRKQEILV